MNRRRLLQMIGAAGVLPWLPRERADAAAGEVLQAPLPEVTEPRNLLKSTQGWILPANEGQSGQYLTWNDGGNVVWTAGSEHYAVATNVSVTLSDEQTL